MRNFESTKFSDVTWKNSAKKKSTTINYYVIIKITSLLLLKITSFKLRHLRSRVELGLHVRDNTRVERDPGPISTRRPRGAPIPRGLRGNGGREPG